jgi:hypothetical protein
MPEERLLLAGCGILKKEIRRLIEKNRWPLDTVFLDSSLHCDMKRLEDCLKALLARHNDRNMIIFYGTCHPLIDRMLSEAHTFRTSGQNCVEILLGHDLFTRELANGAFFILEDWAQRWEEITIKGLGTMNPQVIREIYREGGRNYLLCLRTPCSGDFSVEAAAAGDLVGLPVRWLDVTLDHLEAVLQTAINRKIEELQNA